MRISLDPHELNKSSHSDIPIPSHSHSIITFRRWIRLPVRYSINKFANEWGITITTSSPHYPKSNGMAERYVQTVKQFMRKAGDLGDDIYAALLAYRQTSVS